MKPRVLVACEFSGRVREAFARLGADAWSCDIRPTEIPGQHIEGDVLPILDQGWDLMVCHPPCTHLAISGAHAFEQKRADGRQQEALDFVWTLLQAPIPRIALENPVSIISTVFGEPTQVVNPYWFGEPYPKRTCLWLKNLPPLVPTDMVEPEESEILAIGPRKSRDMDRSRTYQGMANAMADQWFPSLTWPADLFDTLNTKEAA